MRAYQTRDEAKKYFAASPGSKRHPEVGTVAKNLAMADVNPGEFLTSKYSLWLDLRSSDDDRLHGSGYRLENASKGITIQITKKAEAAGALIGWLSVLGLTALGDSISVYIGPTPKEMEKEERKG